MLQAGPGFITKAEPPHQQSLEALLLPFLLFQNFHLLLGSGPGPACPQWTVWNPYTADPTKIALPKSVASGAPSLHQVRLEKWDFFLGERAGYPDGQEFRVCLFLPDTKAKQVFYLLPGKVSKMVVLTNRPSCKTQRTSRSRILCPRHLPLAPWVEPAEPREAECARNVLPHLLPMGMSPAIYPAWACWGMPAKPSWMLPGACLLGPQWSVRTSAALLPFHSMPEVLLILPLWGLFFSTLGAAGHHQVLFKPF